MTDEKKINEDGTFTKQRYMFEHVKTLETDPEFYFSILIPKYNRNYKFFYTHNWENLFELIDTFRSKYTGDDNDTDKMVYCVNEIIVEDQPRKPYFDIEYVYKSKKEFNKNYKQVMDDIIEAIIDVFEIHFDKKITRSDILLTSACGTTNEGYKLSYHVVISTDPVIYFTSGMYSDSSLKCACDHLQNYLKNKYGNKYVDIDDGTDKNKNFVDDLVYSKNRQMRIIYSHKKYDCGRQLVPVNSKTYDEIDLFSEEEKLDYLITYINPELNINKIETPLYVNKNNNKKSQMMTPKNTTMTDVETHLLDCARQYHPTANSTIVKGYLHAFNYTDRTEKCPISGHTHKSNGFYLIDGDKGIFLKCHSSKCKGSIFVGYSTDIEEQKFINEFIPINQKYLIMEGGINDDPEEDVKKYVRQWLSDNKIKTLGIRSPMGSGKSTLIQRIFEYDKTIEKVLIITHRMAMAEQTAGKHNDFKNYMHIQGSLYKYNKIIVQIDSLDRLKDCDETGTINYKKYDLVIVDELESSMAHINSPYLYTNEKSGRDIFQLMLKFISISKKLLVLDADMGIRSKLFIDYFGKSILINNNYKTPIKTFTITNEFDKFENQIINDLKNGLNIFVASMSAGFLHNFMKILEGNKIKYLIHSSKSDDSLKKELKNVNDFWSKYQFVGISPSIDSAIDFNKKHFDKIYCFLQNGMGCCSQRTIYQMVGRIRNCPNRNIITYYDGPTSIRSSIYTFDDVLNHAKYFERLNGVKLIREYEIKSIDTGDSIKEIKIVKEISLYDLIYMHNHVEFLNKNPSSFMTVFAKILQKKGHQLVFNTLEKAVRPKNNKTKNECEILLGINEKEYDLNSLIKKEKNNKLSRIEKYAKDKLFFMLTFNLRNISDEGFKEFYLKFYNKRHIIKNFETFFGFNWKYNLQENIIDNYFDSKDRSRKKIIANFLSILLNNNKKKYSYTDFKDPITIGALDFHNALIKIKDESEYFRNEKSNIALFNGSKNATIANMKLKEKKVNVENNKLSNDKTKSGGSKTTKKTSTAKTNRKNPKNKKTPTTTKNKTDKKNKKYSKKNTNKNNNDDDEDDITKKLIKILKDKFKLFGINLIRGEREYVRLEVNGKMKSVRKRSYSLSLDPEIMNILKKKYGITNEK